MSLTSENTQFGYLVLTMTPADYLLKTLDPFTPPNNPDTCPTITQRAIDPTITRSHWEFLVEKKVYGVYRATEKSLKLQLLATVEEVYYRDLHDDDVGCALVSTKILPYHLWSAYGQINDNQLSTNAVRMRAPWSTLTPIDNFFEQLKSCMKFISKCGDPITITAVVLTGTLIVEENGLTSEQ